MVAVAAWIGQSFLRIGVLALAVELFWRFYTQVLMLWLVERASWAGLTFPQTDLIAAVSVVLELLAVLLWGLFTLGFAIRVLAEFARLRGDSASKD